MLLILTSVVAMYDDCTLRIQSIDGCRADKYGLIGCYLQLQMKCRLGVGDLNDGFLDINEILNYKLWCRIVYMAVLIANIQ